MFKKILWATDGSEAADHALRYVEALAKEDGASVQVLHVVEFLTGGKGAVPLNADQPETQAKLEQQVAQLNSGGVDAKLEVVHGHQRIAAHAIAEAAQENGADVIVVGTRGHTRLGTLITGSVTQRVLQLASCPVLAVPDHD
jgi:nucleotide-binding universal stress UspA family protein